MATRKIIAVVGATGAQGEGLVRAILADESRPFAVRAITRHPESDKARALAEIGAQIVAADIDDFVSIREAFEGAYAAFCVTNYWEHHSPDREQDQARNMARAADACRLRHVIWSTLEDIRKFVPLADDRLPTLQGRYKVPHFDGKGASDHYFSARAVPTTYLRVSFYWENLIHFGMGPRRISADEVELSLPLGEGRLPGIGAADIGRCAYGIFRGGRRYIGRTIGIAGEHPTGQEMAAALTEALGERIRYHAISPRDYRALGFPGADDLANMFQFQLDNNEMFCRARSIDVSRELNPYLMNFRAWLKFNKNRITIDGDRSAAA